MSSPRRLAAAILLAVAALASSCSPTDPSIRGVVVDVQGDLVDVDRFTVVTTDGDRMDFVPAPDVRFHDGAPLSHLTEHLRNGEPIEVTYRTLDDGTLAAMRVEDVGS